MKLHVWYIVLEVQSSVCFHGLYNCLTFVWK